MNKGIGFYTRVIHSRLDSHFNEDVREKGLTRQQTDILNFVIHSQAENRLIKQRDIEETFHLSNPTVSGILTRLEQKDLVTRTKAPEDRRIHYIDPTEKAIELEKDLSESCKKQEDEMLEGIDPQLVESGMKFLEALSDKLCAMKKGDH